MRMYRFVYTLREKEHLEAQGWMCVGRLGPHRSPIVFEMWNPAAS